MIIARQTNTLCAWTAFSSFCFWRDQIIVTPFHKSFRYWNLNRHFEQRLGGSAVKNLPVVQEAQELQFQSLGQEDPLEEKMATHFSILAWKIPWTEKLGRLQSLGLQKVGHSWATSLSMKTNWNINFLWARTVFTCFCFFLKTPNIARHQFSSVQFSPVQSLSRVRLFATPWIAAQN